MARKRTAHPASRPVWVNLVKWLGGPSIRWHRDKLAGRAKIAAAKPGAPMPVAAEVLSVTKLDELLTLDVGARLDLPGSPRVRLEYDRDQQEFIGEVPVPASANGEQVTVYFDVVANGSAFSDSVPVSLRHSNREFSDTAPDAKFMDELATAGAGKRLESPADAAEWIASVAEARARQSSTSWQQPLWPIWQLLATILTLLTIEWMIRRRSMLPAAVIAAVAFFILPLPAAEAKTVEQWITQLGAEKVRERDEAEDALLALPESVDALKRARTEHPTEEGRLRATNVLRTIQQSAWVLEHQVDAHRSSPVGFSVIASPDGKHFYTRGEDDALQWDVATMTSIPLNAELLGGSKADLRIWSVQALAITSDGKQLFVGSDSSVFTVYDIASRDPIMRLDASSDPNQRAAGPFLTYHAAASADGKQLATVTYAGRVFYWSPQSGKLIRSEKLLASAQRIAYSPNSKYLAFAIFRPGVPDVIMVQRLEDNVWTAQLDTAAPPQSLVFSPDGTMLASGLRNGSYDIYDFKDGKLGPARVIYRGRQSASDVRFSKDGKSLFVGGTDPAESLSEVDVATGEIIWKGPDIGYGCASFDLLGDDRIIAPYGTGVLRIWKRRH